MQRCVALILLLVSVVRGDVDGLCVTLNCGIQSGACFLDGECAKVLCIFLRSNLHAIYFSSATEALPSFSRQERDLIQISETLKNCCTTFAKIPS